MLNLSKFKMTRKASPISDTAIHQLSIDVFSKALRTYRECPRLVALTALRHRVEEYFRPSIELSKFKYFYFTNGITDGLNYYSTHYNTTTVNLLSGEYEYLNLFRNTILSNHNMFYITNPSAIDGNYIDAAIFSQLCDTNKHVVLDCAYLGTAEIKKIDIHPNIETVFLGLSKTLGIPDYRIGYIFTNKKLPILHGIVYDNLYFNMPACLASIDLLDNFELGYLHTKYKDQQSTICNENNLTPSDVFLFGTTTSSEYNFFKRGSTNRICLTEKMKVL